MNAFTPGARRAAEAREAARILSQPTYHGQPCARGHSGQRYTSDQHCVECRAARTEWGEAQRLNTIAAASYPKEFDELGWNWHRLAVEEGV